jgi:hypothetical protein
LQTSREVTVPPSWVHSPSVRGAIFVVDTGGGVSPFLSTAEAAVTKAMPTQNPAVAEKIIRLLMMPSWGPKAWFIVQIFAYPQPLGEASCSLFDHLVGASEHGRRNIEADRLRGL